MNYELSSSKNNTHTVITPEQLNELIETIADHRYSWACVLMLRFLGYNPLHYIPQRTYSRLIKENNQFVATKASRSQKPKENVKSGTNNSRRGVSSNILKAVEV